jgi:hypothetical protein
LQSKKGPPEEKMRCGKGKAYGVFLPATCCAKTSEDGFYEERLKDEICSMLRLEISSMRVALFY